MRAVDFAAFVDELATVSAAAILPFFRTAIGIDDKRKQGQFDPVTDADRAGEVAMRSLITRTFPEHGILGEEFGRERADATWVWTLDPIDGTKSFIAGIPAWGTLIGLMRDGVPVYGMMHQPFVGERFTGDGAGARYRGPAGPRDLMVRPCTELSDAVLFTTSPRLFADSDLERFQRIEREAKLSRYGGDCYAYCMVAAGLIDVVIETGLDDHDIVPLIPIIEGAGGIVTNWEGGTAAKGGRVVAAGDRRLHDKVLKILNA
ncbi:histidinol-phosphatase [Blastochloris viridis]|uniref:Histidinol-phosphatase n=1 Tax=Blastochloris viridis TaxID=1079 RepID=A0A0H5BPR3_BLAVI|nr:histidinol-phosphatase [Blastochloris viridis]ALK10328.1 Histidinol-phosphatase [Blastochloris viridis]BAR99738.1 histidinol-phosphatase [Blastochloris viridis]CUU42990.1 Histidinol-phosphatase [Blastochloris viridis]